MKKLITALSLAIILVVSVVGSAVMAAPPPENKPVDAWDMIVNGVNELIDKIGFVTISVANVQSSVDDVQTSVDNLSESAIIMVSDSGVFEFSGANPDPILHEEYDRVAHVSVTAYSGGISGFDTGDSAWVVPLWDGTGRSITVVDYDEGIQFNTVEFDAKEWKLNGYDIDGTADLHWAYTATYPASNPE
ncbi:hypothetical protein ACFLYF_01450 [Chloroflexota bacterium]